MSKNIVICLDGTWNDKDDEDKLSNVALLHEMSEHDPAGQLAYYDKGVGTDGWYDKKLGGVHGSGLSNNIREAYAYLAEHYDIGDAVYIFGFSRGAFTARSLAGLLFNAGLPNPGNSSAVEIERLYDSYKSRNTDKLTAHKALGRHCPVRFLGVWDTVGALGIPVSFLRDGSNKVFGFHDTRLSPEVVFACHAVSIDEKRASFEPTLWHETPDNADRIQQVWFSGVHSDVGGGYPERHLSDIALKWMCEQASSNGWREKPDHGHVLNPDPTQAIHSSAYKLFGKELGVEERLTLSGTKVHSSVLEKISADSGYDPVALKKHLSSRQTLEPYNVVD